ncbi:MAG: RsmD family RNA methyltransferase [Fibrobacter sp.]|jgi:16S rRNA (guanine966-N2)-methyltransferase|nr:RsmD family RNA methyltransferase [Fibrobacter sp.]
MSIRITGGTLRSRLIPSPPGDKTRPTASVTREALFNILADVSGAVVLDLFSGSGIIGLEALSRGAFKVYAVEKNRRQAAQISSSYQLCGFSNALTLLEKDALSLLNGPCPEAPGFDLIYADPPFTEAYPDLRPFYRWLSPGGVAVFEAPSRALPVWAEETEIRRYGESSLLLRRASL